MLNKIFRFTMILAVGLFFCCSAEDFLMPRTKKQNRGQVKQNIVENLADILQYEIKSTELNAQVQQKLCELKVEKSQESLVKEILKAIARNIKAHAQIQLEVYNRIQEIVDKDTKAFLNKATSNELVCSLKELENIKAKDQKEQQELSNLSINAKSLSSVKKQQESIEKELTARLEFIKNGCAKNCKK